MRCDEPPGLVMIDLHDFKPVLEYRDGAKDRGEFRVAAWERLADGIIYAAVWGSVGTLVIVFLGALLLWGMLVAVAAG